MRNMPIWMRSVGTRNETKTKQSMRLTGPRIMVRRFDSGSLSLACTRQQSVSLAAKLRVFGPRIKRPQASQ